MMLRLLVSMGSYSGKGKPPMFGDFEAQRHWMEVTHNLPPEEWYFYDLEYWGIDYPPLSAWHSRWLGYVGMKICGLPSFGLDISRGSEHPCTFMFMRASVLVADVIIWFPSVLYFSTLLPTRNFSVQSGLWNKINHVSIRELMLFPCLLLVDHGHFQFNSVSLGLALLSFTLMLKKHRLLGAITFVASLLYKQMALYYALPVFFYLLRSCIRRPHFSWTYFFSSFFSLAIVTSLSFVIFFYPFYTKPLCLQVLHRVFPVARGLFEDKVANVWCTLSPLMKRQVGFTLSKALSTATIATLLTSLPPCLALFWSPSPRRFVLSLLATSLSFYLFSFQVHEKTILLPLLPSIILSDAHPMRSRWFQAIALLSMLPLFAKDGILLQVLCICGVYYGDLLINSSDDGNPFHHIFPLLSIIVGAILSGLALYGTPPAHLPDLFVYILTSYCCIMFVWMYALTCYDLFRVEAFLRRSMDPTNKED